MLTFLPATPVAPVALVALAVLSGCASAVPMHAAPDAVNILCAEVVVRLPETVGDAERRETNAQGTGAWGTPAQALLQCGVEADDAALLECRTFNEVDWLIDPSDEELVTATSFGRDPAIRVAIDKDIIGPGVILDDLAFAVSVIPASKRCS